MAASDADGKRSLFRRGLTATRLALAVAVTVIILTIVVYAVVVVSRKEQLALSVAGGIIHLIRALHNPNEIKLIFSVEANNPSGRVRFYYTDVWARVVLPENGTNSTVPTLTFALFRLGTPNNMFPLGDNNMDVAPVSMLQRDAIATVESYDRITTYFNELRNDNSSSITSYAMLKLNGTLTVGLYSVHNKTSQEIFYYCYPLTIGTASNASADAAENIQCQNDDPTN